MGLFLGGSAVPNAPAERVRSALQTLAARGPVRNLGEGLGTLSVSDAAFAEINGHTTVVYPDGFVEWDEASKFLSESLKQPTLSFHIHDGDLWMFVVFADSNEVARFNPWPDYWDKRIQADEVARWAGDASALARLLPGLQPEVIQGYFVRWTPQLLATPTVAYQGDNAPFGSCWQLVDFLRRCGFAFPELVEPASQPPELSPEVQALVEKRSADRLRFEAEQAWHARQYPKVLELLTQLGADIRPSEQKKIDYCRKRAVPVAPRRSSWWRFWR